MDRNEKKRLRDKIGEKFDLSNVHLKDSEAQTLSKLIDNYDSYRGRSYSETHTSEGWCSEGRYSRTETKTYTFPDEPGIQIDCEYHDDDGESGSNSRVVLDAREILGILPLIVSRLHK